MARLKIWELPLVVFLTGGAVLVVEVAGTRILSPHFGNTIFSLSSVLSVILAALSVGYYAGGIYADRHPKHSRFYSLILLGGSAVLLLEIGTVYVLPFLGLMPVTWGPLVSSLVLFFAPAVILGMLSPFAIKLQSLEERDGIGRTAGTIYFWSTLGSIAGSLSTGFLLIPFFDLSTILISVSAFLVALGLAGLASHGAFSKRLLGKTGLLFGVGLVLSVVGARAGDQGYLFVENGVYERLAARDVEWKGRPARFFMQDKSVSSGMYLDTGDLVFEYTEYYKLYEAFDPDPEEALFIGAGVYSMPKALRNDEAAAEIDVVDIEPKLIDIAERHFGFQKGDPKLRDVIADGRRFLRDTDKKYDIIFSDAYHSLFSVPSHMTTREFFELAKSRLSADGVFIANVIGALADTDRSFTLSELRTFREVFPEVFVFAAISPDVGGSQNLVFVGTANPVQREWGTIAGTPEGRAVEERFASTLVNIGSIDLSRHRVLRDDHAPVEYLNMGIFDLPSAEEQAEKAKYSFDGEKALSEIGRLLSFGPRSLRSPSKQEFIDHLKSSLESRGLEVALQSWDHASADGVTDRLTNIIARYRPDLRERIIIGTHYDTKRRADRGSGGHVPGANDGTSGVAVALELAEALSRDGIAHGVDLVFFDGEEGEEDLSSVAWSPLGSVHFAENIRKTYPAALPRSGIVLDMVCDKDLRVLAEENSVRNAPQEVEGFWEVAHLMYPEAFPYKRTAAIEDDHVALARAGIPSILLIDFEYPHFHTESDTLDKCAAGSLEAVGRSVEAYLSARIERVAERTMTIGTAKIALDVARTDEERRAGLSGRSLLEPGTGMLFVFDAPGRHGIWMKDMRFPIDIIWLDESLKAVHVERRVGPETYPRAFLPASDARYVVELPAGTADRHGIRVGTTAEYPSVPGTASR